MLKKYIGLFDLSGKNTVVPGGAIGIGRAGVLALAQAGASIAVLDKNRDMGRKTVSSIRVSRGHAEFLQCDVSIEEKVDFAFGEAARLLGQIDIAVNAAGTGKIGDDHLHTKANWDRVIETNLTGIWLCNRAAIREMIKHPKEGGKIINIASVAARTVSGNGNYSASKAGVVHLTHSLAAQCGR